MSVTTKNKTVKKSKPGACAVKRRNPLKSQNTGAGNRAENDEQTIKWAYTADTAKSGKQTERPGKRQ